MRRVDLEVLFADVVLLAGLYFVLQDLSWRSGYAASPHDRCAGTFCSYAPSFSYNVLTRYFTMSGSGLPGGAITSPATLDWVQVFLLALVVINVWYGYTIWTRFRGSKRTMATPPTTTM